MNEPRNGHANAAKELQAWIVTMSAFVKRMAPYQLVTVGDEVRASSLAWAPCILPVMLLAAQGSAGRGHHLSVTNAISDWQAKRLRALPFAGLLPAFHVPVR